MKLFGVLAACSVALSGMAIASASSFAATPVVFFTGNRLVFYSGTSPNSTSSASSTGTTSSYSSEVTDGIYYSTSERTTLSPTGTVSFHALSAISGAVNTSAKPAMDFIGTTSISGISDTLTIRSGAETGIGHMYVSLAYDGSVSGRYGYGDAFGIVCEAFVICTSSGPTTQGTRLVQHFPTDRPTSVSGETNIGVLTFTYGVPFTYTAYLIDNSIVSNPYYGEQVGVETDFYDTASLLPFRIVDSTGALDSRAVITSDSGLVDYAVASAPEPSTWTLMILGVFGVGAALRKRRLIAVA